MTQLTAKTVKEQCRAFGADAVAIGNIERWEGAPIQQDPKQVMPEARSVIAMAFRVNRGSMRGVEEGTFFSNYSAMGYGGLTYLYMPMTVINVSKFIEDHGKEAIPYGHQSDWREVDQVGELRGGSVPVAPGRAAPDVMVNLRIAAYLCGLGEIGWSKMFLTPEFGPRQRVGIIITEAELEPDPIMEPGTLCDQCMACAAQCPGQAIPKDKSVKVNLGGYDVEWADVDMVRCDICFRGAEVKLDDDGRPDFTAKPVHGYRTKPGWWNPFRKQKKKLYNTGQAICGARGCTRACMIAMEKRNGVKNTFDQPFRRRKPWRVDWEKVDEAEKTKGHDSDSD